MPDLLVRNLPQELHARLKAQAKAHRRSLAGEVLEVIEKGLQVTAQPPPAPVHLPPPIPLQRPTTMAETLRFIDDNVETRGMPDEG